MAVNCGALFGRHHTHTGSRLGDTAAHNSLFLFPLWWFNTPTQRAPSATLVARTRMCVFSNQIQVINLLPLHRPGNLFPISVCECVRAYWIHSRSSRLVLYWKRTQETEKQEEQENEEGRQGDGKMRRWKERTRDRHGDFEEEGYDGTARQKERHDMTNDRRVMGEWQRQTILANSTPLVLFQKDLLCFTYFLSYTCCYSSDAHIKLTVTTVLEFINRNKEYSTYKYTLIIV